MTSTPTVPRPEQPPRPGRLSSLVRRTSPQVPEPPRALVLIAGIVALLGTAMTLLGAARTGLSWDEPYHVMRLTNFLDHGWYALDWSLDSPAGTAENNTAVYGPVAMLLLHGLGALVGVEPWGAALATPEATLVRHLGIALLGLLGTAAAGLIARHLLDSRAWGLVTVAVLLALPMWTGHAMFNPKDIPVATGYTVFTLGLVLLTRRALQPGDDRRSTLGTAGLTTASGIVLMVGTRPGMIPAVLAGVAVAVAGTAFLTRWREHTTAAANGSRVIDTLDALRRLAVPLALALAGAATTLVAIYPNLFAHPELLIGSAEQSASFRGAEEANPGYIPFFVLSQTPLLLLGFEALIAVVVVRWLVRSRLQLLRTADPALVLGWGLVATQLLALPVVAILTEADLYNALRQLLFAVPAWAVITTAGIALAWRRVNGSVRRLRRLRRLRRVVLLVSAAALLVPMADQARLFPYQYAYYNAALDAVGVYTPSDYWRTSIPELLPRLPRDGVIVCSPTRTGPEDPTQRIAHRFSGDRAEDCRTDPLGPLAGLWAAENLPLGNELAPDTFYAIIDRGHPTPQNCTQLDAVTRPRHGREVTMTSLVRCRLDPLPLSSLPTLFQRRAGDAAAASGLDAGLWDLAPLGWTMRDHLDALDSTGTQATLAFRAPQRCRESRCDLILQAELPSGKTLTATVRTLTDPARPASVLPSGTGLRVALPPGPADRWVELRTTDSQPLDVSLRSLRITPTTTADPAEPPAR